MDRESKKQRGLMAKYSVERVDGKPVRWAFVLEDKDPLVVPALLAYARGARAAGYGPLADDLEAKVAALDQETPMKRDRTRYRPELVVDDDSCPNGWQSRQPCSWTGGCYCERKQGHRGRCRCVCGATHVTPREGEKGGRSMNPEPLMTWGGRLTPIRVGQRLWARYPWPEEFPWYARALYRFGMYLRHLAFQSAQPWVTRQLREAGGPWDERPKWPGISTAEATIAVEKLQRALRESKRREHVTSSGLLTSVGILAGGLAGIAASHAFVSRRLRRKGGKK